MKLERYSDHAHDMASLVLLQEVINARMAGIYCRGVEIETAEPDYADARLVSLRDRTAAVPTDLTSGKWAPLHGRLHREGVPGQGACKGARDSGDLDRRRFARIHTPTFAIRHTRLKRLLSRPLASGQPAACGWNRASTQFACGRIGLTPAARTYV
jgi:hypothetical protein